MEEEKWFNNTPIDDLKPGQFNLVHTGSLSWKQWDAVAGHHVPANTFIDLFTPRGHLKSPIHLLPHPQPPQTSLGSAIRW